MPYKINWNDDKITAVFKRPDGSAFVIRAKNDGMVQVLHSKTFGLTSHPTIENANYVDLDPMMGFFTAMTMDADDFLDWSKKVPMGYGKGLIINKLEAAYNKPAGHMVHCEPPLKALMAFVGNIDERGKADGTHERFRQIEAEAA
jgi:hypothetical protein